MDKLLVGQSTVGVEFKDQSTYPWRSLIVGTSFFVARDKIKFSTLASLASRTGKRHGKKFKVKTHEVHPNFTNGCYEVACIKLTANYVAKDDFEAQKLKFLQPAPVEIINDPVAYAEWQRQAQNAQVWQDLQGGQLEQAEPVVPMPEAKTQEQIEAEEFERVKALPWNKVEDEPKQEQVGANEANVVNEQEPQWGSWSSEFNAEPMKEGE